MKSLAKGLTVLIVFTLAACGGAGDSDSSGNNNSGVTPICNVTNNTITLLNGNACEITAAIAVEYSVSAGVIRCEDQQLNYNGGTFSAGSGYSINGLSIVCN